MAWGASMVRLATHTSWRCSVFAALFVSVGELLRVSPSRQATWPGRSSSKARAVREACSPQVSYRYLARRRSRTPGFKRHPPLLEHQEMRMYSKCVSLARVAQLRRFLPWNTRLLPPSPCPRGRRRHRCGKAIGPLAPLRAGCLRTARCASGARSARCRT